MPGAWTRWKTCWSYWGPIGCWISRHSDMEETENYPFETARLRKVISLVADEAGWGRELPEGQGLGIAAQYSFLSYVAAVVEVAVDADGRWKVPTCSSGD